MLCCGQKRNTIAECFVAFIFIFNVCILDVYIVFSVRCLDSYDCFIL